MRKKVSLWKKGQKYLDKTISQTESLTLTHRDYSLSFEFAALNFDQPQKNQYAYKLEGLDEDWIFIDNRRRAYFTNLDPGNYTLKVRGSNNDGRLRVLYSISKFLWSESSKNY